MCACAEKKLIRQTREIDVCTCAEQKLSRCRERERERDVYVCVCAEQKLSRQTKREREVCARAGKARPHAAVPAIL